MEETSASGVLGVKVEKFEPIKHYYPGTTESPALNHVNE